MNIHYLSIPFWEIFTNFVRNSNLTTAAKYRIQIIPQAHRAHGGNTNTFHHEEHEGNEVKPGSAGRRTGFMYFAFGDQRLAVGSRPVGRRWQVTGNNYLFAWETRTVPGSPSRPSSRTFLTESLHCIVEYPTIMRDPATLDIEYLAVLLDIGY